MVWLPVGVGFAAGLVFLSFVWTLRRRPGFVPNISLQLSRSDRSTATIVRELKRARREILVPARSFSCPAIASVLLSAIRRGIAVQLHLHRASEIDVGGMRVPEKWQHLKYLIDAHYADSVDRICIVIDRRILVTGGFNFDSRLTSESSNGLLLIDRCPDLAEVYARRFLDSVADLSPQKDTAFPIRVFDPRKVA